MSDTDRPESGVGEPRFVRTHPDDVIQDIWLDTHDGNADTSSAELVNIIDAQATQLRQLSAENERLSARVDTLTAENTRLMAADETNSGMARIVIHQKIKQIRNTEIALEQAEANVESALSLHRSACTRATDAESALGHVVSKLADNERELDWKAAFAARMSDGYNEEKARAELAESKLEQARTQLAGCLTAAEGVGVDSAAVQGVELKIVLVEWDDSMGCASSWSIIEDGAAPQPLTCRSVGWLLFDTETSLTIVPHLSDEHLDAKQQGCGDMTIPKSAVRKIYTLETTNEV